MGSRTLCINIVFELAILELLLIENLNENRHYEQNHEYTGQ
jgi:hypothetical protein